MTDDQINLMLDELSEFSATTNPSLGLPSGAEEDLLVIVRRHLSKQEVVAEGEVDRYGGLDGSSLSTEWLSNYLGKKIRITVEVL